MDLNQYNVVAAAEQGAEMELLDPYTGATLKDDETGEPVVIALLGHDSGAAKQAMSAIHNRRQSRGRKNRQPSLDELAENNAEFLARLTTGWRNLIVDGEPLDFSFKNAKDLYLRFPWIKEQADEFIGDRSNFTDGGSKK